jgi:hypothetical protein
VKGKRVYDENLKVELGKFMAAKSLFQVYEKRDLWHDVDMLKTFGRWGKESFHSQFASTVL